MSSLMYHNVDFSQLGGYPLTQDTLEFLQEGYNETIRALAGAVGNFAFIYGVDEIAPGVYSPGWLIWNYEVVPFLGGTNTGFINIFETGQTLTFGDDIAHIVKFTRYCQFHTFGEPFASFKAVSIRNLYDITDAQATAIANAQSTANAALAAATGVAIPAGVIIIWKGSVGTIPTGWVLCDGNNGTPDLRDKFVAGAGNTYAVGASGGANTVTLTTAQMPAHNHTLLSSGDHQHYVREVVRGEEGSSGDDQTVGSYTESGVNKYTNYAGDHNHVMGNAGSGAAHENRPPYYALAFIMKL